MAPSQGGEHRHGAGIAHRAAEAVARGGRSGSRVRGARVERSSPCRTSNLTIREGDFVTIVGPSGCGKSTLGEHVRGADQADDGSGALRRQADRGAVERARHGVPGARRPALADRCGNIGHGLEIAGVPKAERQATGRGAGDSDRPRGLREQVPARAVGRHAPARRGRPHLGPRTAGDPHGRAVRRRRRDHPADAAGGADQAREDDAIAPSSSSPTASTRRCSSATTWWR